MITRLVFSQIQDEVIDALNKIFDDLRSTDRDRYILLLADGEYVKRFSEYDRPMSPYCIDYRDDGYRDESRIEFFSNFMNTYYSFPSGTLNVEDDPIRLTLELMVYCHIWESSPFLKQLFRLAELAGGGSYPWKVSIPKIGKHKFVNADIRDVFASKGYHLATIIKKGFHSSLRNAFAHSEYTLDKRYKYIYLESYQEGTDWDIEKISFNDWAVRFSYSAWLSYGLYKLKAERRRSIVGDFGTNKFRLVFPINDHASHVKEIFYDENWDAFHFSRP